MSKIKGTLFVLFVILSSFANAQRKEVREIYANDREMKIIHLTLGRSTILSFGDRPVKVNDEDLNHHHSRRSLA